MSIIKSMGHVLENKRFARIATGATATVLIMTGIKAVARPAFIYADKKADAETKKYTATKEFLYQILCLGITFVMLPIFKAGGFKLAEKYIQKDAIAAKILEEASTSKGSKINAFKDKGKSILDRLKKAKEIIKANDTKEPQKTEDAKKTAAQLEPVANAINAGNGGEELGALIGSVLGLTIIAPLMSHHILHPIMKALGMEKKPSSIGTPNEIFLADAKVETEKGKKVRLNG